jgi:hypothetical protein
MKGIEKTQKGKRLHKKKQGVEWGPPSLDFSESTGTCCLLTNLKEKIADSSDESYIEFDCPVEDYLGEIYDIIKYDCQGALSDLFFKKAFLELRKRTGSSPQGNAQ